MGLEIADHPNGPALHREAVRGADHDPYPTGTPIAITAAPAKDGKTVET